MGTAPRRRGSPSPSSSACLLCEPSFPEPPVPAAAGQQRPSLRHRPDRCPPFDDVLEGAREHAGWAFTCLYESLAPAVTGYVRSQGVREAEDVASEVFVAVLCGCSSFRGDEAQFRRWVFTIAHHRIVDRRRAAGRNPEVTSLDADGRRRAEPGPIPAAEDDALRHLGTERVHHLLSLLSVDQRCVLALRIVADLSVEDVAIALDKPPGAVKALQRRALATLRRTLSQEGGGREAPA